MAHVPTSGPWEVGPAETLVRQFRDGLWGLIVADCGMTAEGAANARLIAAAPDLLDAVRVARCYLIAAAADRSQSPASQEENSRRLALLNAALDKADPKAEGRSDA